MTGLTVEKLMEAKKLLDDLPTSQPEPRICITDAAKLPTGELYFPISKNRSKRVYKKLLKRYGSQERYKPACLRVNGDYWIHPIFEKQIMEECKVVNSEPVNGMFPPHGIGIFKGIPPPRMPIVFEPKFKTNLEYEAHKQSIWDITT